MRRSPTQKSLPLRVSIFGTAIVAVFAAVFAGAAIGGQSGASDAPAVAISNSTVLAALGISLLIYAAIRRFLK